MLRECSRRVAAFVALGILFFVGPLPTHAQSATPSSRKQTRAAAATKQKSPDLKAIEILKAVNSRLAATQTLSFVAVDTFESQGPHASPLLHANRSEVTLQRPDKLRVILSGDGPRSQFYCNRNTTMTYSPAENALVIAKAPPTINQCLKDAYKASSIYFPFIDLIAADQYSDLAPGMTHASYVGRSQVVGGTTFDIVEYSGDNVSVRMWVGVEDKLPRRIQVVSLDDPGRLRHNLVLSDWQIGMPVRPEVFTSLKTAGAERMESADAHPVGTSGIQAAPKDRPLTLHTFAGKYWGTSAPPVAGSAYTNYYGGTAQTTPYPGAAYYQSPDGYGYYPPATTGYYGSPCEDCGREWPTDGAAVDTEGAAFDISLATSGWYDEGVAPDYNLAAGTPTPGQPTYIPGQIVTRLPVGCAAPYTRGAAFYLCGNTWFSGVYGPNGELYYRAISVPGYGY